MSTKAPHAIVRALQPRRRGLCARVLKRMPAMEMRQILITVDEAHENGNDARAVRFPTAAWLLPAGARAVLADMAYVHARATGARYVYGRIAIVYGTPCPRWHFDKLVLRGLCTLCGPGCVLRDTCAKAQMAEIALGEGDVVFMRGAGVDGRDLHSAVRHRSPAVPPGQPARIILQTDCIDSTTCATLSR